MASLTVRHFQDQMKQMQLTWKYARLPMVQKEGRHGDQSYPHILPPEDREKNLWERIQTAGDFPLSEYLRKQRVQAHSGRENLLSSWTLAANLYFAFGQSDQGRETLARFLAQEMDARIVAVTAVELEWEHRESALKPGKLLGETKGGRGQGQTSPDLAFEVRLNDGSTGIVLTEVKFTEHNFYACSARKELDAATQSQTCGDLSNLRKDPCSTCAQHQIAQRRYWDHLADAFDWDASVNQCPAATAGYQLFRQQALAEGLARKSEMTLVVSSLAYDARNTGLLRSLRNTGDKGPANPLADLRTGWPQLFKSTAKARFASFSHQSWVAFVRQADQRPAWCAEWLKYIEERYGL